MKKLTASLTLLVVAFALSGCQSAPPAQQNQTNSGFTPGSNRPVGDRGDLGSNDNYSQAYATESRRHRHRGHHGNDSASVDAAPTDNWTRYDRSEPTDATTGMGGSSYRAGAAAPDSTRHHNSHAVTSAPGAFDFYVLNLSWSPEFCHSHPDAAECLQHRAFTLHGLWPQNNDGTYPEDCSEAPGPGNPSQYADIYPDAALLQHEWQTHGTCSGLAADAFLSTARHAEQQTHIPAELTHVTQPITLSPNQIITLFTQNNPGLPATSIAISCGNNYLTAVELCLDKSLRPVSCQSLKTCGANQIRIPPQ